MKGYNVSNGMRVAEVAVQTIGEWKPGKFHPFTPVQVITMKELATKETLNLSLNKKNQRRVNEWLPAIALGNVLLVTVRQNANATGKNKKEYVSFEDKFELKRLGKESPKKTVNKQTSSGTIETSKDAFIFSVETQLGKLKAAITIIQEELEDYKKEG